MKKLIVNIVFFTLPILCWFIVEGFLPSNTYTWRPWEALKFNSFSLGYFYHPNEEIEMESVGDLCHHTPFAIPKHEKWVTDELGYRNDSFIADPDILITGDSYAIGDRVTQDSTITNLLKSDLQNQLKIYNIAPTDFTRIDYYLKNRLIHHPKLVIYIKSERFIPMPLVKYPEPVSQNSLKSRLKNKLENNSIFNKPRIFLDKIFRMYSKNWVLARFSNQKGDGNLGKPGSNMFFLNSAAFANDPNLVRSPDDFEKSALRVITFKNYCDSLGIKFLFVSMPNKATVYYENVPLKKQPDSYISNLDSVLHLNNVKTISPLNVFNHYRESHAHLLYHLDDMHWNSNGVQLVSQEIAKTIVSDYADLFNEKSNRQDFKMATTKK